MGLDYIVLVQQLHLVWPGRESNPDDLSVSEF